MIFFFYHFVPQIFFLHIWILIYLFYDFIIVFLQRVVLYRLVHLVATLICVRGDLDNQNKFDYMEKINQCMTVNMLQNRSHMYFKCIFIVFNEFDYIFYIVVLLVLMMSFSTGTGLECVGIVGPELELSLGWFASSERWTCNTPNYTLTVFGFV